jgi:hypothetical protein
MGRQKVVAIIYIVISPCNRTEGNSKSTIFIYPTPLGQLFKIPPFSAKKSHSEGGRGGSPDNFFSGILLFLLLRIACKIPNTYDKPFCQLHEDFWIFNSLQVQKCTPRGLFRDFNKISKQIQNSIIDILNQL